MFYPITTSSQVAYHDAWLEEMRKEPGPRVGQPARLGVRGRLLTRLSNWLVSTGLRLQARYTTEMPPAPEAPVHSSGASAS
jgi:hypothetical protein